MVKFLSRESSVEYKVVLALVLMLLVADTSLRLIDQRLSGNLDHVESIPKLVGEIGVPERGSLLILGNSLTNNGIAEDVIEAKLGHLDVAKVTPDGTGLWDWQCLLDHQLVDRPGVQVDIVVVGFAWHLLSDQTRSDPSRLGALYCDLGDLVRAGEIGLSTIGQKSEFILARASRTYALRDVLRNALLSRLIPHYERYTQATNRNRAGATSEVPGSDYSYRTFESLSRRLQEKGTRLVLVAMPVQAHYDLDPDLKSLADRGVISLLDFRSVEGIDSSSYLDAMHLNEQGQQVLSRELAEVLMTELASAS